MTYKELLNTLDHSGIARNITGEEMIRLKRVMLSCYKDVAAICKKYNLQLMLGGGSCLGAVRHKGYIPWDDDFDLLMSRKDYSKFQNIFNVELGDKYILNAPNYSENPTNRFPKILIKNTRFVEVGGINDETDKIKIDIFILENIPRNLFFRFIKGLKCYIYMYLSSCVDIYERRNGTLCKHLNKCEEGRSLLKRRMFIGKLFSFFSYGKWCNIVDKSCQYRKETGVLGIPTGRKHYFGEVFTQDVFFPVSKGVFERENVNLPNNSNVYLSNLYGDYMTIPPEEKREKHLIVDIAFN